MQRRTKENGIYLSSVEKNPVINCCEVANSAGTEVLWGRTDQPLGGLPDFQKFLIYRSLASRSNENMKKKERDH